MLTLNPGNGSQGRLQQRRPCLILSYDSDWQYPVITEKTAYLRLKGVFRDARLDLISPSNSVSADIVKNAIVYLAFPWATLIDNIRKGNDKGRIMYRALKEIGTALEQAYAVVSTCQHIHAHEHENLFSLSNVTDLFWSHCPSLAKRQASPKPFYNLYPFQLYPAQLTKPVFSEEEHLGSRRKYLYSFVGAKSNKYYLSNARDLIGRHLSERKDGFIRIKEQWHYQKVVYEEQINQTHFHGVKSSSDHSYAQLLLDSDFSLCPVGTGPNTIRFWESINALSIPVLIGDYVELPRAYTADWHDALIRIADTSDAISSIPSVLGRLKADKMLHMRRSLLQISREFSIPFFSDNIARTMFDKRTEP